MLKIKLKASTPYIFTVAIMATLGIAQHTSQAAVENPQYGDTKYPIDAWQEIKQGFSNAWQNTRDGADAAWQQAQQSAHDANLVASENLEHVKSGAADAWNTTRQGATQVSAKSDDAWDKTKAGANDAWSDTKEGAREAGQKTKNTWQKTKHNRDVCARVALHPTDGYRNYFRYPASVSVISVRSHGNSSSSRPKCP